MDIPLVLVIAVVASFIGSLQAGLVNTAVLATTLRRGRVAGRNTAVGGSIPEILYAGLAFVGADHVLEWTTGFGGTVDRVAGSVMLLLGLYLLFFLKPFNALAMPVKSGSGFWQGILLGLMNPQLLLFWCGVRLGMRSFGVQASGTLALIAFSAGAFIGAMLLLLLLIRLGERLQQRLSGTALRNVFRAVGGSLVLLGAWAWFRGL